MRRRSGTSGEPVKARRRKAATPKRRNGPKAVRRHSSSAASLHKKVALLARERDEALEQQTATAEILGAISRSKSELQPILQSVVNNAARLCRAKQAVIFRLESGIYRFAAGYSIVPAYLEIERQSPISPGPGTLVGRVAMTRQVARIDDAWTDPLYEKKEDAKLGGHRSMIGVPLMREGEPVGVIGLSRSRVDPFSEHEIELVTTFANQAVIAIENVRLFEAEQQRTRELSESLEQQTATSKVLEVISRSAFDLNAVFETVVESSVRLCGADRAFIFRFDGELLRVVADCNASREMKEFVERNPIRPGRHSASARAALERRTIHIPDVLADPEFSYAMGLRGVEAFRTLLAVPILKGDDLLGVVMIYHLEVEPFTDKQVALVETFADQAAIAIENVRLFEAEQRRTRELSESLERQTATSKVLEVISRSAFDLQAVFETVVESSVRLCGADRAFILRFDGELLRVVATHNAAPEWREWVKQNPIRPGRHSASARAALERRTIHIPDVLADPEYSYGLSARGVEPFRTILAVPILKGDDLLGVMIIYHLEVRPFTDKQIALVETFADQAAIAIENVRLLDKLRERTDELGRSVGELRALGEVSQAVNSTLDLETVLSTIVAKAVQLSGTEAGAIYVFDEVLQGFRLRATYGMDQELINTLVQRHIGLDEANVTLALAHREPVQIGDLNEAASSAVNDIILRAGYRALLVAPLLRGEDVVGILVVRRRTPGQFAQNTVDLIKTFAAQSAVAIENARLFQNVEASLQDLRTAQDRLVQTEKLASLGQLTAGIAHEIKNPLNFVNNFSAVSVELIDELRGALGSAHLDNKLRGEIDEIADMLQGNLDKVVQHGKRADSIVKNMLLHSRQGSGEHRPVDINALVDESLNLAYHGARAEKQASISPWSGPLIRPPAKSICSRRI
jgi:two-component system, NtrC family, sensor kinase